MSAAAAPNPYLPHAAELLARTDEGPGIFTLKLRLRDPVVRAAYRFQPGQFNMLYLYGVGEVPISIVSDPADPEVIDHTIRAVGRVTYGIERLRDGDTIGLRGPFGRGWPVDLAKGRGLLVITGGIGCAPTTSAVQYALQRRHEFGPIAIAHGVKRPSDLIYGDRFRSWGTAPGTQVLLAADKADAGWPGRQGMVTELLDEIDPAARSGVAMMCGPEPMMEAVGEALLARNLNIDDIFVSLERNMQCALGHCGNCQMGKEFLCKDGPVFPYAQVRGLMSVKGY